MGTARLKIQYPSKFLTWVKRSGFKDEMDFWSSLSGMSRGTVVDHMVRYLSSLGYGGTPNDQFRRFLKDQVGLIGTSGQLGEGSTFDMANEFFDLTWVASIASTPVVPKNFSTDYFNYEGFIAAGYYGS